MIIEILDIILFFVFQELLLFTFIEQVFNALFNGHTYFFHQVSTLLEIGEKSSRCINIKLQFLKTFVRDNPQ